MTNLHRLARSHYASLPPSNVALEHPDQFSSEKAFLNMNLNNFRNWEHRFYPDVTNLSLQKRYAEILPLISSGADVRHITEKNVLFTTGSLGGIEAVLKAFCEPGKDLVLTTNPTFFYYGYWAKIENLEVRDIPMQGKNFDRLNVEEILAQDAKVIFLCNPNNPAGTPIHPEDVQMVLDHFPGIVVMDEAYIEWSDMHTYASKLKDYDNLVILRTFSKAWGIAGARVGVVLGSETMINTLSYPLTRFSLSAPVKEILTQVMATPELILTYRERNRHLRDQVVRTLEQSSLVDYIYPSVTSFVLFKSSEAKEMCAYLDARGYRILDMTANMPGHARISIGNEEEMDRLLDEIHSFKLALCA